jgi:aminoglycoside 6'-N-acetyltransferase
MSLRQPLLLASFNKMNIGTNGKRSEVAIASNLDISIRRMTQNDFAVMSEWLSTKEVLEFYGDVDSPFTVEQIKRKYEPRIKGEIPVSPYIVEFKQIPIGFMQHYKLSGEEQKEFGYPVNLNVDGIDQFIGDPSYFNQGIGTIMVQKFLEHLGRNTDADIVVLDPELSNPRAIRCYEKCGFVKVKQIKGGVSWLMEYKTAVNQ